jgi:hypothetical protein
VNRRLLLPLVLLLPACTRAAEDIGPLQLATEVAATLTSVAFLPPTQAGEPSATPPPSATVPSTPTATVTLTSTPGATSTPTAPLLPTEDPRFGLNLSVPDYTDDFSERFLWYEFSDDSAATNLWEDGHLRATDNVLDSSIWWSTVVRQAGDVYAEISVAIEACAGKDGAGMAVRVGGEDFDRGYSLELSCDGAYRVRKWVSGEVPELLQDWTPAASIHSGPNTTNRMGVLADGSRLAAFANNQLLGEWTDEDYVFGTFGLYALSSETAGFSVTFDDFAYWLTSP